MTETEFDKFLSQLYAMQGWYNTDYYSKKIIKANGFEKTKEQIAFLLYGKENIEKRWNDFSNNIKGVGIGMMSELLSYMDSQKYFIYNKRINSIFTANELTENIYLNKGLSYNKYKKLCDIAIDIKKQINASNLLEVDYVLFDYNLN